MLVLVDHTATVASSPMELGFIIHQITQLLFLAPRLPRLLCLSENVYLHPPRL